MIHSIVNLVHYFIIGSKLLELMKVLRLQDVLMQQRVEIVRLIITIAVIVFKYQKKHTEKIRNV